MTDWFAELREDESVVDLEHDAFAPENCITTPSPGLNRLFANKSHAVPKGCGCIAAGEKKAGKSLFMYAWIEHLHLTDPEALCVIYNTELRGKFQKDLFKGIDPKRLIIYDTQDPTVIFDDFRDNIVPKLQDGMPLRFLAIDSMAMIGTKAAVDKSVMDHVIGDRASIITKGLDMLIPACKKYGVTYYMIEQIRANIDGSKYTPDFKTTANYKTQHSAEYFLFFSRVSKTDTKANHLGNSLESNDLKDDKGKKDTTGHQVWVTMAENSLGTAKRAAMITIDYKQGIINKHEEIYRMAKNTGIIAVAGSGQIIDVTDDLETLPEQYADQVVIGDGKTKSMIKDRSYLKFIGKAKCAELIGEDPMLSDFLMTKVKKLDEGLE